MYTHENMLLIKVVDVLDNYYLSISRRIVYIVRRKLIKYFIIKRVTIVRRRTNGSMVFTYYVTSKIKQKLFASNINTGTVGPFRAHGVMYIF